MILGARDGVERSQSIGIDQRSFEKIRTKRRDVKECFTLDEHLRGP